MNGKKFTPEIGRLITKIKVDPQDGKIEMMLLFHDREDYPGHYFTIARLLDGKTEPFFGGYTSDLGNQVETAADGSVIVRSPASTENPRLMFDTLSKSFDVREWFFQVACSLHMRALLKEELVRIAKASNLPYVIR